MLTDISRRYPVAQIITHNDLDGYGAGAIITRLLRLNGFRMVDIHVTNTDYKHPFPVEEGVNLVFLTDISISNADDAKAIIDFANNPNNLLFWFDHHQSSIDFGKFYPELETICGIRDTNACGTMLAWIFYQMVLYYNKYDDGMIEDVIDELEVVNIKDIMKSSNPGIWKSNIVTPEDDKYPNLFEKTPRAVILTDDWDRFILNYEDSVYFNEAFYSYPAFRHNCKNAYFQNHFLDPNDETYLDYIEKGKTFYVYKKIFNLTALKENGFIARFNKEGAPMMLCLNSTNKSSQVFGNCFGKRPDILWGFKYCSVFSKKGETTSVSIYCHNPENPEDKDRQIGKVYNAADICKKFNGGGHPGAAGFVTNEKLEFVDIEPLPAGVKKQIDEEIANLLVKVF